MHVVIWKLLQSSSVLGCSQTVALHLNSSVSSSPSVIKLWFRHMLVQKSTRW